MYSLDDESVEKLKSCRYELQVIANEAIKLVKFKIICGRRNEEQQNAAFEARKSKVRFPNSKHNPDPSEAYDFIPDPLDWNDLKQFSYIAGIMIGIALQKEIVLRWGGDWNQNGILKDNTFNDYGHLEFVRVIE